MINDFSDIVFFKKIFIPHIENSARKGHRYPLRTSTPYSQENAKSETTEPSKTSDCQIQSLPGQGIRSVFLQKPGRNTGFSDDFPKEVEDIHKALYHVLKKARRNHQRTYFNFDKLIIDGKIYRGQETKELPFYGNIL